VLALEGVKVVKLIVAFEMEPKVVLSLVTISQTVAMWFGMKPPH
jgi:hypothetical protein